jgi:hypothetical protein
VPNIPALDVLSSVWHHTHTLSHTTNSLHQSQQDLPYCSTQKSATQGEGGVLMSAHIITSAMSSHTITKHSTGSLHACQGYAARAAVRCEAAPLRCAAAHRSCLLQCIPYAFTQHHPDCKPRCRSQLLCKAGRAMHPWKGLSNNVHGAGLGCPMSLAWLLKGPSGVALAQEYY